MVFHNAISWVEIPASDIDPARKFYEAIFDISMRPTEFHNLKMCMFP